MRLCYLFQLQNLHICNRSPRTRNKMLTRTHSSRMCTARSLPYRGSLSRGSLFRGAEGGPCPGRLCPGCLCPGDPLSGGAEGGLCPGGSLSRGVSVQGGCLSGYLCHCQGNPLTLWTDRHLSKYYLAPNFVCGR